MKNNVVTYIIGEIDKKPGSFWKAINASGNFFESANVIILETIREFQLIYNSIGIGVKFRLLIHPELKGSSIEENIERLLLICSEIRGIDGLEKITPQFITRYDQVKRESVRQKKYFVEIDGLEFSYTSFIAGNPDISQNEKASCDDFIKEISVFEKKEIEGKVTSSRSILQDLTPPEHIDYAIQTALYYKELEEIINAFNLQEEQIFEFGSYVSYKFDFQGKKILVVSQHDMGMIDSAILTSEIILKFEPKFIIMPGVCGGNKKTNFGDIIISKKVSLFQNGKMTKKGLENESVEARTDDKLLQQIKFREKKIVAEIKTEIDTILENGDEADKEKFVHFKDNVFKTEIEPTACSTMVIDKKGYFEEFISSINRKTVAVEMEGYGLIRASQALNKRTKTLMIKCVMDKTDVKDDLAKPYAAYISAQFVKKLIEKGILD